MPIDALSVSCAQLTRDLLAIAKFLYCVISIYTVSQKKIPTFLTNLNKYCRIFIILGSIIPK